MSPSRSTTVQRWLAGGLLGLMLTFMSATAAYAVLVRPFASADEVLHADYAVRVYHGELPKFEDGLEFRPPRGLPPVQWVSQHPPLYYVLAAPLVGPFADRGEWGRAVAAGRLLSIVLGTACLPALAWAAGVLVNRRRALWAFATPAVVAPFAPFLGVSASIYNDVPGVLFTSLALGVSVLALRGGLTARILVVAMAVGAAGMLTRVSFLVALAALVGAVGAGPLLHGKDSWPRRLLRGVGAASAVVTAVALTSGWFYLRNLRLTGNFLGAHAEYGIEHLGRHTSPITDVLTSWPFWQLHFALLPRRGELLSKIGPIMLGALMAGALLSGAVALARRRQWRVDLPTVGIALVLASQVLGTIAFRANHVAHGGGNHSRYLLAMLPAIALLLAAGMLAWPRVGGALAALVVVVEWAMFIWLFDLSGVLAGRATATGVPSTVVLLLYAGIVVGVLIQVTSLIALGEWYRRRLDRQNAQESHSAADVVATAAVGVP